jgi:release factor glutamine methyltransferase
MNCQRHNLDSQVELLQGDLLQPLPEPVDVIVANLPYIKDSELKVLSPEIINFEPVIALAGGEDGLDKIRCLLAQAPSKICPEGCLFLEVGQDQDKAASSIINNYFPQASIELIPDLSGINRVVKVML